MMIYNGDNGDVEFRNASNINHGLNTEATVIRDLIDHLNDGDVFYDVGACHGLYSCIISSECPTVDVHSFEPHPNNMNRLKENGDLNDVVLNTHDIALSNEEGEIKFTSGQGPGVHRINFDPSIHCIDANCTTLDNVVLDDYPSPSVIKIDVEGAEYQVLDGARELLSHGDGLHSIYIEMHFDGDKGSSIENYEGDEQDVVSILEENGFSVSRINDRKNTYHISAHR